MPPGAHRFELVNRRYGYRGELTLSLEPGQMLTHTVSLPSGVLRVRGAAGTEVWVEGEHVGALPLADVSVPIGTREVVFRHPQHGERRQVIEVGAAAPAEVTAMFGAAPPAPPPSRDGRGAAAGRARADRRGAAAGAAAAGAAQRAASAPQRPVGAASGRPTSASFGYHTRMPARPWALVAIIGLLLSTAAVTAQQSEPFTPQVGQPGKDVVWVPTPEPLVEKMLDLAKVGPDDFVIDLGSGDGRNVIGAARRGARALGVEYNPDMVELSRRKAAEAGVAGRATFERGDMYEADISRATVMALFLLPSNLLQLRPKFLALAPGSRIVSNTFLIADWTPDASTSVGESCEMWCEAHLWIVPAQAGGRWRLRRRRADADADAIRSSPAP